MSEWYYGQSGQQEGPFDETTMRSHIASGKLGSQDLVWHEGMAEWLPLSEVSELTAAPAATPESAAAGGEPVSPVTPTSATYAGGGVPPTSGLAIASLVCGILAILSSCVYIGVVFGIPAVICGHLALKSLKDPQVVKGGGGMAMAGLICGYLGSLISIGLIVFVSVAVFNEDGILKEALEAAERAQQEQRQAPVENAD